jgi:acid phosphatase type 7
MPARPQPHLLKRIAAGAVVLLAMPVLLTCSTSRMVDSTRPEDPVALVEVVPSAHTLAPGETVQLVATVLNEAGDELDRPVSWTTSNQTVASVTPAGRVTAGSAGQATITATVEGKADAAQITVRVPAVPVASVTVTPSSATVETGRTVQLTATVGDASGNTLSGRQVTWVSSNPALASVSTSGLVSGTAAGRVTISATSEGKVGTSEVTVVAPGAAAVLVGAGDIADCDVTQHEATAKLLDGIAGTVMAIGDNAYEDGTDAEYATCYQPTWGRHKARTRPAAGNHDYHTSGASGYYKYFGAAAGDPSKGYYSYNLGAWHIVVVNSNISVSAGSAQEQWLRADLAASTATCTLAYWHHPRFSSGYHGNSSGMQAIWQALYDHNADVVVSAHEHDYERFAPQTPTGTADPVRGIREFIVGTGGRSLRSFNTPKPNSEVRNSTTHGVIKFTLHATGYDWQFIPIAGKTFTDSGTASCH